MSKLSRTEVLARRAQEISCAEQAVDVEDRFDCIVFDLATEKYAVEIRHVREVHPLTGLTPIPCTPAFVLGVINVRGHLYPVVELKRILGLPEGGLTNATRAIVIHDALMEFGIVADAIIGVRGFSARDISARPASLTGIGSDFVRGVSRDRIVLLKAESILAYPGLVVNEEVNR
jgi:purine-binding chemotaxis protein CheW